MVTKTKKAELVPGSGGELSAFLRSLFGTSGKPKEDVAIFVPIRLALPTVKTDGVDSNSFPWTFSTFDVDRFSERVDPTGWELDDYRSNPVVLWAHNSNIPAIGKAENVEADENGLRGEVVFSGREYDPFGWAIGERVKAGIIRAGSVGFQVLEVEIPDKAEQGKGVTLIFRKQALLEFSICNVPANPFALGGGGLSAASAASVVSTGSTTDLNHGFMPLLCGNG